MLLMTTMSAFSSKTKFGSGAAILVMSTSLVVLAGAVGLFAVMGDAAIDGLIKVAAGLTALSVASQMSGVDGAASILTMSSAMLVLAGAVAIYARLGDAALGAMVKCGVALAGMGVAVFALSKLQGDALQAAWVISTLSGGMIKLAAACAIFNFVKWGSLLSAGVALGGLIAVLLGAGALNSVFPMLSAGLTVLGTAFDKFVSGALKLTGAMAIIGVLSMFAGPICTAIINAAPDIQDALIAVVKVLCNTIIECAEPLTNALIGLIEILCNTLISTAPQIAQACRVVIESVASEVWQAIKDLFRPLGTGDWWMQMFNDDRPIGAFVNWVKEIFKGAEEQVDTSGFEDAGKNISEGLAEGELKGKDQVEKASEEVAQAAVETTKDTVKTHSPSLVMEEIGRYITEGLALGIADPSALAQAKANMLHAATSIRNVFTTFWGIHSPSDVAASDAENILEGAILGIGDKTKQDELRNSAYNAALAVKDGMTTALDEATIAVQNSMVGLYNAMKMDSLHLGNPIYQNGLKGAQNAAKQAVQDNVPIPSNSGIKKPGSKTPSTVEEIKNAVANTTGKLNPFGVLTDYYQNAVDDALDGVGGGTTKSKASKTGKSLADTLASAFSDQLKANKTEMSNATGEYALWEVTGGDTATVEELITKKTESLTREIELQTKRVAIAKEQYDTLLAKVGANNSKTKDAYGTLLSEQKTLAELQRSKPGQHPEGHSGAVRDRCQDRGGRIRALERPVRGQRRGDREVQQEDRLHQPEDQEPGGDPAGHREGLHRHQKRVR